MDFVTTNKNTRAPVVAARQSEQRRDQ